MKKAKDIKHTLKKKGTAQKAAVKMSSMQKSIGQKSASRKGVGSKIITKKITSVSAVRAATAAKVTTPVPATKIIPPAPVKIVSNGNGHRSSTGGYGAKGGAQKNFTVTAVTSTTCIFKLNEKVVYPAHGVGIIDSIEIRVVGGTEHKFYMITILETGMKIMVPLAQVETVGLRRVVDEKTIEKVYDILRDRNVVVDTQTWNRRYREYTQKLKTGSLFEIAKVIRDLSVLRFDKELSFGERKMLDTAQGLLVKEISIAKARPEDKIKQEIQDFFHAA